MSNNTAFEFNPITEIIDLFNQLKIIWCKKEDNFNRSITLVNCKDNEIIETYPIFKPEKFETITKEIKENTEKEINNIIKEIENIFSTALKDKSDTDDIYLIQKDISKTDKKWRVTLDYYFGTEEDKSDLLIISGFIVNNSKDVVYYYRDEMAVDSFQTTKEINVTEILKYPPSMNDFKTKYLIKRP